MKTENKPCCNSKSMGIHLAHNIRIRLALSWLDSVKFTFFSMSFCAKWAWSPPDNATSSGFSAPKSWVSELSSEASFVSVLAMVLSEYWQRLEKFFQNKVISSISQNDENYKNIFPLAFFKILKKPLLVQKQTIPQKKGLILSFLELKSLRVWHFQEDSTPTCRIKTLKKSKFNRSKSGRKKKKN